MTAPSGLQLPRALPQVLWDSTIGMKFYFLVQHRSSTIACYDRLESILSKSNSSKQYTHNSQYPYSWMQLCIRLHLQLSSKPTLMIHQPYPWKWVWVFPRVDLWLRALSSIFLNPHLRPQEWLAWEVSIFRFWGCFEDDAPNSQGRIETGSWVVSTLILQVRSISYPQH